MLQKVFSYDSGNDSGELGWASAHSYLSQLLQISTMFESNIDNICWPLLKLDDGYEEFII